MTGAQWLRSRSAKKSKRPKRRVRRSLRAFDEFRAECRRHGIDAVQRSRHEWAIKGDGITVTVWPARGGARFRVDGTEGKAQSGGLAMAIETALRRPAQAKASTKPAKIVQTVFLGDDDWGRIKSALTAAADVDEQERPNVLSDHRWLLGRLIEAEEDGCQFVRKPAPATG